jgi:hypothetical protein
MASFIPLTPVCSHGGYKADPLISGPQVIAKPRRPCRWDSSRARPLQIDIQFASAPLGTLRQRARAERQAQQQQQQGGGAAPSGAAGPPQDIRLLDAAGSGSGRAAAAAAGEERGAGAGAPARPEYAREFEGGFMIYDDDLGLAMDGREGPAGAGPGGAPHWEPVAGGGWGGRGRQGGPLPPAARGEEFPSLATAAAVAAAAAGGERDGGGGGAGGGQAGARRPPPLVKKTVKCPCGRWVGYVCVWGVAVWCG